MKLLDADCPICGKVRARLMDLETRVARPRFLGNIVRCLQCGLGFVWPRPGPQLLEDYYEKAFEVEYLRAGVDFVGGRNMVPEYLKARLSWIESVVPKGRLLDVGAGTGAFVRFCRDSGWEASGTEIDPHAAEYARKFHEVNLHEGDLLELHLPSGYFDVVHMNHVLEHVPDPLTTLCEVKRVLNVGGLLIVEVPHEFADLVWAVRRVSGQVNDYRVPTPHLYFYTPETLGAILAMAGFSAPHITTHRRSNSAAGALGGLISVVVGLTERLLGRGPILVASATSRQDSSVVPVVLSPSTETPTFSFGRNWRRYVEGAVTEQTVERAKESLLRYLPANEYRRSSFIDVGSGSGLFSLAAILLGCREVISFDIDGDSVKAAELLKAKFLHLLPADGSWQWKMLSADILDESLVSRYTNKGDIVYAWGVLHHTGQMWKAITNASRMVRRGGHFILAIYNHAPSSSFWHEVKRFYNKHTRFHHLLELLFGALAILVSVFRRRRLDLSRKRGMHIYYDAIDWIGGFPYEYACFGEVQGYVESHGFRLTRAPTKLPCAKETRFSSFLRKVSVRDTGCNEFLFRKVEPAEC